MGLDFLESRRRAAPEEVGPAAPNAPDHHLGHGCAPLRSSMASYRAACPLSVASLFTWMIAWYALQR